MTEKFKRHPNIIARVLPDGYVLLEILGTDSVHTLTPLAGMVWEFCDGENTLDEVIAQINQIEQVQAAPNLREQVAELLGEFQKSQLVSVV
jgi:hypothetical protein